VHKLQRIAIRVVIVTSWNKGDLNLHLCTIIESKRCLVSVLYRMEYMHKRVHSKIVCRQKLHNSWPFVKRDFGSLMLYGEAIDEAELLDFTAEITTRFLKVYF
jgi:hypothetical protein